MGLSKIIDNMLKLPAPVVIGGLFGGTLFLTANIFYLVNKFDCNGYLVKTENAIEFRQADYPVGHTQLNINKNGKVVISKHKFFDGHVSSLEATEFTQSPGILRYPNAVQNPDGSYRDLITTIQEDPGLFRKELTPQFGKDYRRFKGVMNKYKRNKIKL